MAETVVASPDTSAPSISISTPPDGVSYAQGQVVDGSYSCSDPDGAGDVASCSGSVPSGSPIDTSTAGSHSFTVNAADRAGNSASKTVHYTVDASAPSISITTPANGATYTQGQVVDASYSCSDPDGAGDVASCSGPVPSGTPIDTSTTGSHSFTVKTADRVGNSASQTVSYTVGAKPSPGTPKPRVSTSGPVSTKALGATVLVDPGIKVSCPTGGSPCTADETASVQVPATVARAKKTRRVVIGRAHFTISAGKSKELTFKLNREGARLLRKLGRLRVKVTVVSRVDHNKPITTTKTITIKAPPHKHKHKRH
jgi:hypothetical protein